jgi:predicted N-acetyltransferase YhbS
MPRLETPRTLRIAPLLEHGEHLDTVADWLWDEWKDLDGQPWAQMRASLDEVRRPASRLALVEDQPVGVLLFKRVKFKGKAPLRLFINALYVTQGQRRRGVASALVEEAARLASESDDVLFVYTHIAPWYERRGFTLTEGEDERGNVVLSRRLGAASRG